MFHLVLSLPLLTATPNLGAPRLDLDPALAPVDPYADTFRGREAAGALGGIALAEAAQVAFCFAMQDALTPITGVAFRGRGWLWAVPLASELVLPPLLGTLGAYLTGSAPRERGLLHALKENLVLHGAEVFLAELSLVVGALTGQFEVAVLGMMLLVSIDLGLLPFQSSWTLHEPPFRSQPVVLPSDLPPPPGPPNLPPPSVDARAVGVPLAFHF